MLLDQDRNRNHVLTLWKALDEVLLADGSRSVGKNGRSGLTDADGEDARVDLKVSMEQVVSDPELAAVAQERLDEARLCHRNGAYTSAIIMLGSLLEGVLISVAKERLSPPPKRLDRMGLESLIKLARDEGWIGFDVEKGSDLIRMYRNLVHPRVQVEELRDPPDSDTVDICWPIVNATLNDLAATAPPR